MHQPELGKGKRGDPDSIQLQNNGGILTVSGR
jgi:hypothetical protein